MARKFIIDTDTGSDDAVALIMALRWPDVEVEAITMVAGNVPVDQATRNALYTAELVGHTPPVYVGADRPLVRKYSDAKWFHGNDGMGNMNYPEARQKAESKHAVDAMIDTIKANPGIVMVTLGPLTNVALAVQKAPEIIGNVSRCITMAGTACSVGNVTPAGEYNVWCDPDAAQIVFHSGLPIEMAGWEISRFKAHIFPEEMEMIRAFKTEVADFALDCNRIAIESSMEQSSEPGLNLPDPVAMAIALEPSVCTRMSKHYVEIETQSDLTRGITLVDQLGVATNPRNRDVWAALIEREPNVSVCWEIDVQRWKEMLYQVLR